MKTIIDNTNICGVHVCVHQTEYNTKVIEVTYNEVNFTIEFGKIVCGYFLEINNKITKLEESINYNFNVDDLIYFFNFHIKYEISDILKIEIIINENIVLKFYINKDLKCIYYIIVDSVYQKTNKDSLIPALENFLSDIKQFL